MTPTTPRLEDVNSLRVTITELTNTVHEFAGQVSELSTQMQVHNAKQDPMELLVRKHEIQLNGDPEKNIMGIAHAVDKATRFMNNLERGLWVVVGVLLSGGALWLIDVLKAGLK